MLRLHKLLLASFLLFGCVPGLRAQLTADPTLERGLKPYGSFEGGSIDSISMTNGDLNIHLPLLWYPQRGGKLHLGFILTYNNNSYLHTPRSAAGCDVAPHVCEYGDQVFGPVLAIGPDIGLTPSVSGVIPPTNGPYATITTYDGSPHEMGATANGWRTIDASGYLCLNNCATVIDRQGIRYSQFDQGGGAQRIEDPNGNYITVSAPNSSGVRSYVDTMGRNLSTPPSLGFGGAGFTTDFSGCTGTLPTATAYVWSLPGYQGGQMNYKICYANVYFGGQDCIQNGTLTCSIQLSHSALIQSIVLPNNTAWTFQYDSDNPSSPTGKAGNLLQITFPTGGYIKYAWNAIYVCQTPSSTKSTTFTFAVSSRTVNANDGTGEHAWTYSFPNVSAGVSNSPYATSATDPLGQKNVHTMTALGGTCSFYDTQTQSYDSAGALVKTVTTDYHADPDPMTTGFLPTNSSNVVPIRVTTTWLNGQTSKVETDYDSGVTLTGNQAGFIILYGNPVARREYDYGNSSPGALIRTTTTAYQAFSNSSYLNGNLLSLPSSIVVTDGSGALKASTIYFYDQFQLASSGVTIQHDSVSPDGNFPGNATSVQRWLNGSTVSTTNCPITVSNGSLTSYTTYNDTGAVNQSTDACGTSAGDSNHTTTFAYSSAFTGAYPTSVTNALGQTGSTNYDFNTGLVMSQTDLNGQVTTLSYDSMWRATQVSKPDGGQTTFCYTDTGGATCAQAAAPFKVVVTKKINATQNEVSTAVVDGLGRKTEIQLNSDPACASPGSKVDTTYGALGRVASVTNPFCTTSDPTYGVTTYSYDALNRATQVTHPDGTSVTTSYAGRAVQVTDEGNGTRSVQRISQSDGLGRLLNVCEVSSATLSGTAGTPAACGLDIAGTGFLTTYTYDTLNNLTNVSQGGFLSRSFTYDSLSRLTQATNPESGTIAYTYDANGNVITKTDARGIVTTYSYDKLNRLTTKSYSDTTPAVSFVYDACPSGACPTGIAPNLPVGRMVKASTANTQSFFSYDPVGRVSNQWQCTPVNCGASYFALGFGYDVNGDLTTQSNGFGVTLTNAYDSAARLTSVTSSLSDSQHPPTLLSGIQYNALGLPSTQSFGNTLSETLGYDTRMRLTSLIATSPTATGPTPGTGSATVNGSEQSIPGSPATAGTGSVTISGAEKSKVVNPCAPQKCIMTVYDGGTVSITVNGFNKSVSYGTTSTTTSIASALAGAFNGDSSSPVSATASSNVVSLTSKATGSASNYSLSASVISTGDTAYFPTASFSASASGSTLTGGANPGPTTYDAGTLTITVNGVPTSASYNSGSNANALAATLASGLSSGSLVNATASGNVITITSKTAGANTNYSLAVSSSSSNGFSPPSFSASASGSALTGGAWPSQGTVYGLAMSYAPNGDVLSANDSANGNWTYGYDDFNRLRSSNQNSGAAVYSYVYDRFGNRLQQNGLYTMLLTFSGNNNRMDGYTYDLAGNVTYDLNNNYTYDAEYRIVQVSGTLGTTTYVYDALGQRVRKTASGVTTDYVYDLAGNAIVEVNGSGGANREEIFAGGKHVATYVNNTTYFSHADWLGTERVRSDMTGAGCETITSLPFGDGQTTSGNCGDPSTRHFTGKERDSESNLDYFGARYYSSNLGRWLSADWSSIPVPVPYANLTNPQTLNLYAMVGDNPGTFADLDGHIQGSPANAPCSYENPCNQPQQQPQTPQQQEQKPPDQVDLMMQASAQKVQDARAEQNRTPTEQDMAKMIQQAGAIADIGVKAAMIATSPQYVFMAGAAVVEAAPGVTAAARAVGQAAQVAEQHVGSAIEARVPGGVRGVVDFVNGYRSGGASGTPMSPAGMAGVGVRAAVEIIRRMTGW